MQCGRKVLDAFWPLELAAVRCCGTGDYIAVTTGSDRRELHVMSGQYAERAMQALWA
jgi:hypothetical protein